MTLKQLNLVDPNIPGQDIDPNIPGHDIDPSIPGHDIDPNIPGHGPQTGRCVPTKDGNLTVCEIYSWCPVEDDHLLLGTDKPLISGSEHHTVLIKNSIKFSYFGEQFHRNNMPDNICVFNFTDQSSWQCNIFKLGRNTDIVIITTIIIQILVSLLLL